MDYTFDDIGISPEQCMASKQTYTRGLYCRFTFTNTETGETFTSPRKLLANIPVQTQEGDFVWASDGGAGIKANRYVLVMQLAETPGLYYYIRDNKKYLIRYCLIRSETGTGILFTEVINNSTGKFSKFYRLTKDKGKKYKNIQDLWEKAEGKIHVSLTGKRQMYWSTSNAIESLEVDNPSLTIAELVEIGELFDNNLLKNTDDRSLATRRVLRYQDYLPRLIKKGLAYLAKDIAERWLWTPEKERQSNSIIDRLIGFRPLQDIFDSFFSNNNLFQLLDSTNPLAEISLRRRVTLRGPGGYPEKALLLEKRDVHPTDFGRLCPVETPQGENLGFSLYMAKDAEIDEMGFLCAKYINLKDQSIEWLNVYDEISRNIVAGDGLSKDASMNQARSASGIELMEVEKSALTHQMPSPHSHLGYAASLIPFLKHNDANRALMGANMMKQALQLLHKQVPYVITGLESDIAEISREGSSFVENGQVLLGVNILTGYLPWDYYTYEDAVAISDSLVRNEKLTHVETEVIYFDAITNKHQREVITSDSEYLDSEIRAIMGLGDSPPSGLENLIRNSNHDYDGVIKEGTQFKPGDILVSKLRLINPEAVERDDQMAAELMKIEWRSFAKQNDRSTEARISRILDHMEDASLYAAQGIFGKVLKVEWIGGVKDRRRLKIVIESHHPVRVGDKLTGRHGNKGVISRIIPEREMPYFLSDDRCCNDNACSIPEKHTHLELLINPLTITSRMNLGQLYETASSWLAKSQLDGCLSVPPFSCEWTWEKIRQCLTEKRLRDRRELFYWENDQACSIGGDGDQQQAISVGYQYILKLKHLSEKKNKARNQSVLNPATGQPITPTVSNKSEIASVWENRVARKNSAQRLGEMEVWALQGHGAWHLLDELLFLKSDSNHLKYLMVTAIHESNRARNIAFERFEKTAAHFRWQVQSQGDHRIINGCAEDDKKWLVEEAMQCGLRSEELSEGNFKITHAPLEVVHRAHQAFKTFALYCRGLGFEVEGVDNQGEKITLTGCQIKHWPRLKAVTFRLADDKERKEWSRRQIKSHGGLEKHGLWPEAWDNPQKWGEETVCLHNEGCDYIELPIPIDNPLFRTHLRTLLSFKGCRVDGRFMREFQWLLSTKLPAYKNYTQAQWKDYWKESLACRSRLLMEEDVLAWLKVSAPENTEEYTLKVWLQEAGITFSYDFRRALPARLTAKNRYASFPTYLEDEPATIDRKRSTTSPFTRLHIRDLYRHFKLMDMEVLEKRVRELPDYIEKKKKEENDDEDGKKQTNKTKTALLDLLNIMNGSGYHPKDFFFCRLTVLPRNLRYEYRSPRRTSFRSTLTNYVFDNDLNYTYQLILLAIAGREGASDIVQIQEDIEERQIRPLIHALLTNRSEIMTPVKRTSGEPLHGIIDLISGADSSKKGFPRRYLLGKRLDYSGRGVIIPDPELGLDEASIPFGMGLVIYREILIQQCMQNRKMNPTTEPILDENRNATGRTRNIPNAVRVARAKAFVSDKDNFEQLKGWLQEAAQKHPILLNRAPSLHRLSILSFNVRFHDDTPGRIQADDCIHLNPYVCSPFNADFDGDTMAVHVPFLPSAIDDAKKMLPSRILRSPGNGRLCIDHKKDHALAAFYRQNESAANIYARFDRTAHEGPEKLQEITAEELAIARKQLKQCGFSLGISDFIIAQPDIQSSVKTARERAPVEEGLTIKYWLTKTEELREKVVRSLPANSPLQVLHESGAGKADLQQMSAIRGIMKRPGGSEVPWPILTSIVMGMTPLEYFVSCHGSRNGLADKGLLTGPAGDITNTMIQAAQGVSIIAEDCGTNNGLKFEVKVSQDKMSKGADRFIGRFAAEEFSLSDNIVIKHGDEITEALAEKIADLKSTILLRSPVTCEAVQKGSRRKGLCQKCYGRELARGTLPEIGYPAGIIAAQSIGEPGTQLTLSSFHSGGAVGQEKQFGIMDIRKQFTQVDGDVQVVFKNQGINAAAEEQLAKLQEMYIRFGIADQHFEVIIRTMFNHSPALVKQVDDNESLEEHGTCQLRSVLEGANDGDGPLSRIAFKDVTRELMKAVLGKDQDQLSDCKSKVMIGQVI
jgi:DNA-directed RNA polymerase beta subunit/DNA-directed RNA polymerase beta' subunit